MLNKQHLELLQELAPIDALEVWVAGDFGIGDEPTLIGAIRKDERILLSDDAIVEVVCDAMDEGLDAQECIERLITLSQS